MFLAMVERHGLRPPRLGRGTGRQLVGPLDAISRLAVLAAALVQREALAAQAGSAARVCGSQPVAAISSSSVAPCSRASMPTINACLVPGRTVMWLASGGRAPFPSTSSPCLSEPAGSATAASWSRQAAGSSQPSSSPGAKASTASLVRPMAAAWRAIARMAPALVVGLRCLPARALAKVADAHGRPGLAVGRFATHPVHGDREIAVRPLATELADDLDRTRVSIGGIAPCLDARDPHLRVSPADPVDQEHRFVGGVVEVDHDLLHQQPDEALLGPSVRPSGIPCGRQVVGEPQENLPVDLRLGGSFVFQLRHPPFECHDTLEGRVPPRLELARDIALGRIYVLVAALGEGRIVRASSSSRSTARRTSSTTELA